MKSTSLTYILIFNIFLLFSCQNNKVHHLYKAIPNYGWIYPDENVNFQFDIKDTVQLYNISFFVTNTDKYSFCNLYYQYRLYDSAGNTLSARLGSIDLYDCKLGSPLGSGSTGIFTKTDFLINDFKFPYIGKYGLEIMQYMRLDTLKGIQSVGMSVERK